MTYDLLELKEHCLEIGISHDFASPNILSLEISKNANLCIINSEIEKDCLIGFEDTPWHFHGDYSWEGRGYFGDMDIRTLLTELTMGAVLICEELRDGKLVDRSLVHKSHVVEFDYLNKGEEIRVFRANFILLQE